jgi:hypothetical protein
MRPIKFDLPLNGTRIANLEQLEDNLTPEILEPFRSGKLAKWLRARSLDEQAEAVEALLAADVQDEVQLFIKLCEVFELEVDEDIASDMIEDYKTASSQNALDNETEKLKAELAKKELEIAQLKIIEEERIEKSTTSETKQPQQPDNIIVAPSQSHSKMAVNESQPKENRVINQHILKMLIRANSGYYVTDGIPKKKLLNTIKHYAKDMDDDVEVPLVLLDQTIWGSADAGFVLTDRVFYCREIMGKPDSISLDKISKVYFSPSSGELRINDKTFYTSKSESLKIFANFLNDYLAL